MLFKFSRPQIELMYSNEAGFIVFGSRVVVVRGDGGAGVVGGGVAATFLGSMPGAGVKLDGVGIGCAIGLIGVGAAGTGFLTPPDGPGGR